MMRLANRNTPLAMCVVLFTLGFVIGCHPSDMATERDLWKNEEAFERIVEHVRQARIVRAKLNDNGICETIFWAEGGPQVSEDAALANQMTEVGVFLVLDNHALDVESRKHTVLYRSHAGVTGSVGTFKGFCRGDCPCESRDWFARCVPLAKEWYLIEKNL